MAIDPRWSQYAVVRTVGPGEYVFKEGDRSDELYLIVEGQVAVIKDAESPTPVVLSYKGEDELIGEVSLLGDTPRTASILALEPTTLLVINRDDFWRLFDEKPTFRQMVVRTVIDRLLAADESRVHAAATERALFDRLFALSSENERLAEVVHLRQETMRFIVHDLRNPLNLVVMALNLIESDPDYGENAETRRFLKMASGGVQRMFAMTESLLDVERLESGAAALHIEALDLRRVVDEAADQYRLLADSSQIALEVTHEDGELPVMGDYERLVRVVTNLIDNGLKFTPTGKQLAVRTRREGSEVCVSVEDSGPGIPEDQRTRIFDRFVQVGTWHDRPRGFGLGLTYCRSAVRAHGGRIWVEDGVNGVGSRFVFTLPAASGQTDP